jgi:hypothetical protein
MVVTLDTTDPRAARALALLPQARTWTTGHRKSDGRAFLIAPGSNGHGYYVDANGAECTCPDRQTRRVDACKHMLVARLLLVERGEQPAPAPRRATCAVCTLPLPAGVASGECAACADFLTWVGGVAAIKAAFGAEHPDDVVRAFGA